MAVSWTSWLRSNSCQPRIIIATLKSLHIGGHLASNRRCVLLEVCDQTLEKRFRKEDLELKEAEREPRTDDRRPIRRLGSKRRIGQVARRENGSYAFDSIRAGLLQRSCYKPGAPHLRVARVRAPVVLAHKYILVPVPGVDPSMHWTVHDVPH